MLPDLRAAIPRPFLFCFARVRPDARCPEAAAWLNSPASGRRGRSFPASGKLPMKELDHFIAGQHVKGASGRFGDVFDPATGEVQAKVAFASRAEVRKAVEA